MKGNRYFNNIVELLDSLPDKISDVGVLASNLDISEGAGRVATDQIQLLKESGYQPTAISFNSNHKLNKIPTVELCKNNKGSSDKIVKFKRAFFINKVVSLSRELSEFDVVIVHQPLFSPAAYLSKVLFDTKTIYFNHHVITEIEKEGIANKIFFYTGHKILSNLTSKLDIVVSVSNYSRKSFLDKFGVDGPIIYNDIDETVYHSNVSGEPVRKKYGISNSPTVLYVGRLARSKQVDELIDIFDGITTEFPDAVLLIVGRREMESYYHTLKQKSKKSGGKVIFTGTVPENELPNYYAAADVYATCSIKEGYNLTIAEAEACGTKTIAYDIGAHSEVMTDGTLIQKGNTARFRQSLIDLLE